MFKGFHQKPLNMRLRREPHMVATPSQKPASLIRFCLGLGLFRLFLSFRRILLSPCLFLGGFFLSLFSRSRILFFCNVADKPELLVSYRRVASILISVGSLPLRYMSALSRRAYCLSLPSCHLLAQHQSIPAISSAGFWS